MKTLETEHFKVCQTGSGFNMITPYLFDTPLGLVAGPRAILKGVISACVAQLAGRGPARLLDAGNCFDAHRGVLGKPSCLPIT